MSVSFVTALEDAVIANAATTSNVFNADEHYQDAAAIGIMGKTVPAETYSIQVSNNGTDWYTLQEGATLADLPVPAVNKAAVYIQIVSFKYFRLARAGSTTIATFKINKHFTTT